MYARAVPVPATASLRDAERRTLDELVRLLRAEFGDDLHGVCLYGPRAGGGAEARGSDLDIIVLLEEPSGEDRIRALELWRRAALTEAASDAYFSIKVFDRTSVEHRALDSFLTEDLARDKVVLHGRS
jgi:predicted nucleotidyltransferase